jgi:putative spermidine/putrescine transport system substrate-binding protein
MAATIIGAGLLAAGAGPASARDLTVVSWGGTYQDAQREIYFKPFAKLTGKPLLDESWDGGIGVVTAKVKAGSPNWDVVQVEAEELALGCSDGLYEKIDWSKLGGKDGFLPSAVNECGVGAIVWSTALSYDADKLKDGPKSWADFWDTKKFPGKRSLRKSAKYALEFALMADGVEPAKVYDVLATPAGVDRAFKKLDEIKSSIVWWESGAQPLQLLSSGEVVMAAAYNGRITGINKTEKKHFKVVWPGSIYAVDSWVILKGAENKDAGMDFITFASKPENQVKLPQYVAYGLPVKEAAKMVPADQQADLPTAPENLAQAIPINVDFWVDNSEALTKRFNAWLAQ